MLALISPINREQDKFQYHTVSVKPVIVAAGWDLEEVFQGHTHVCGPTLGMNLPRSYFFS